MIFNVISLKNYNIIFLLIDGARIDRLSQSEHFTNIIKQGTFYSHMIAHAPYTLVQMNSIFTGMYGGKNGIDAYYKMFKHPKDNCKTLAEYFTENGWYTQGDAMRLSLVSNRGFKKLTQQEDFNTDYAKIHCEIIDEVLKTKEANQPFFLYLHYPKIHHQIQKSVLEKYNDFSEEYFSNKEKNLENYDSYLKCAGEYLQTVYDKIISEELDKNSIIIVMADHGMGVGEKKGEKAYGAFTYDYSIRTFALFIHPKIFPSDCKIDELTRTIDIMPTILGALDIKEDPNYSPMQGENLIPLIGAESTHIDSFDRIAFCETGGVKGPWPSPNKPNVKCVRTKKWKLIHNLNPNTWELYNLIDDPQEINNIIDNHHDITEKLKTKFIEIEEDCRK